MWVGRATNTHMFVDSFTPKFVNELLSSLPRNNYVSYCKFQVCQMVKCVSTLGLKCQELIEPSGSLGGLACQSQDDIIQWEPGIRPLGENQARGLN